MKMSKRLLALMLAGTLLCGSAGCSGTGGNAGAGDTEASELVGAEETALSLMRAVNTGEAQIVDDNYRTWYEVFVYSFFDSNGDGVGDINGLTAKLDYINDGDDATMDDLGCNGIWLMPIMPSTTYHKYDVIDYMDIDPEYGTLEDFKTLIEACHERGINVIIDLVMNHSSSQHEWFKTAAAYLRTLPEGAEPDIEECPYVDYYHFSREAQSGYAKIAGADWYYEAQFWSEMPDLNLESDAVRAEFTDIVDFWLELGVDGFRLDAAKEFESGNVEVNVEILSWFDSMVEEKKEDAYIVAEVWNNMDTYTQYYASGIDSCFNFAFAAAEGVIAKTLISGKASGYGESILELQNLIGQYSDSYIDAPFYANHDMARSAGYYNGEFGVNRTKMGHAMNLLMSGSAFLYYGEELGMKGSGKDENKRAPMYWFEDAKAEGMCHGPLDMDKVEMKYGSLQTQQEDGNSIYAYVCETIRLRNQYPEIARGVVTVEETLTDNNVCVIRKTYDGSELLLAFNPSEEPVTVDLSGVTLNGTDGANLALGGMLITDVEAVTYADGTLTLPPYSVAVIK